ncbi:hypothetical protein RFI_25664 [Reticulomyxa filosa]|uniref:Uncharacterized protein n=1 Tax=Reticulomyxa filosa TaxID=46433 RepID=X6MDG1_RETFI|nr:hypothetical protein RFI_25664 [Reticulomyxa filosa]|eukprot:ETO11711.1 hypothetical protein RFI_25664 [Reticulomyxa filosa]
MSKDIVISRNYTWEDGLSDLLSFGLKQEQINWNKLRFASEGSVSSNEQNKKVRQWCNRANFTKVWDKWFDNEFTALLLQNEVWYDQKLMEEWCSIMDISLEKIGSKLEEKIQRKMFQPLIMVFTHYNFVRDGHRKLLDVIGWKQRKHIYIDFKNEDRIALFDDMTSAFDVVTNSENGLFKNCNVKLWGGPISMPTFIRVKYPCTDNGYSYCLEEMLTKTICSNNLNDVTETTTKVSGSSACSRENIMDCRVIFRYHEKLPMRYHLLQLIVKDPKPVMKKLEHLNMPAYILPIFYLKEVLSKVVEHWLRTCTAFIDNNSKCSIATSAICLDLILGYYGFVKKKMEIPDHSNLMDDYNSLKRPTLRFICEYYHFTQDVPEYFFEMLKFTSKPKKFCKKQKREKYIEKPYQIRTFHGKSNHIKLRSNYQTYRRMRLRI